MTDYSCKSKIVPKDKRMVRVGDMLVASRIVSSAEITEAIQVSKRLSVPIGRVLITSGCVTEKILHAALDLQSLIREGEVPLESALKALTQIEKNGCTVKESLEHLNFKPKYSKGKNDLADLLVDSNLVSQEQIDEALTTSFEFGTPLGSTLVFQGALSPNFFPSISAIQEKVTRGELSNEQAIDALKEAFSLWLKAGDRTKQPALKTIEDIHDHVVAPHRKRHLEAKAATNPRAQEEIAKDDGNEIGSETKETADTSTPTPEKKVSVKHSAKDQLPQDIVQSKSSSADDLEDSAGKKVSDAPKKDTAIEPSSLPASASEAKTKSSHHDSKQKRTQPPSKHNRPGGRLVDLLSAADLLDQENLPAAYQLMLQDTHRSGMFLVESGLINDDLRRQAERCHNLVRRGRLSPEQAIRALKSSRENELTFREALTREGFTQPVKLDKDWQTGVAAGVVGGFLAAFFSLAVTLFRLIKKK